MNAAGASDAGEDGGASHDDDEERTIPPLEEGQQVKVEAIRSEQHFTKPPARYNQALLVKELEKNGIGRPSTYASIITKLLQREYVVLQKRAFYATHLGCVVSDYLVEHFNNYVDYEFTAHLEERLDDIAGGELRGGHVLETFWRDFNGSVQETLESGARYERKLGCRYGLWAGCTDSLRKVWGVYPNRQARRRDKAGIPTTSTGYGSRAGHVR